MDRARFIGDRSSLWFNQLCFRFRIGNRRLYGLLRFLIGFDLGSLWTEESAESARNLRLFVLRYQ
jgi:hypothetical protein